MLRVLASIEYLSDTLEQIAYIFPHNGKSNWMQ